MMKQTKLIIFVLLIIAGEFTFYGQDKIWLPAAKPREEIINHTFYSLSFIEAYELSSWIAYELKRENLTRELTYKIKFDEDPDVSTGSASMKDYKTVDYLIGQLAPVEDMMVSETTVKESFYLTNAAPMKPAFYKYTWEQLGDMIREWARDAGTLYVVTGPVLADAPFPTFGPNMVSIPQRYYKVVLDLDNERGMGFVVKNSISSGSMKPYAMSIDEVEKITGIDFFPEVKDDLENKIESTYDPSKWDFEVLKK